MSTFFEVNKKNDGAVNDTVKNELLIPKNASFFSFFFSFCNYLAGRVQNVEDGNPISS